MFRDAFPALPAPLRALAVCAALTFLLASLACGPGEEPVSDADTGTETPEPNRLENQELGIVVVDPAGGMFEPESNEPGEIRLSYAGDENFSPGTVIIGAEPEQDYGVNLVDEVNAREAELELMPDGEFYGQVELGSENLGTAYSTRGRYTNEQGQEVEELKIFAVHPTANRLLHLTYRYEPAPGQTQARLVDQAMTAFGYIEPLEGAGAEGSGEEAGAAEAGSEEAGSEEAGSEDAGEATSTQG